MQKKSIPFSKVIADNLQRNFQGKELISPNLKSRRWWNPISEEFGKSIQNTKYTSKELNEYFSVDGISVDALYASKYFISSLSSWRTTPFTISSYN